MSITTKNYLKQVKKVVENSWTQDAFGRNSAGVPVGSLHPDATTFCLTGALNVVERSYIKRLGIDWTTADRARVRAHGAIVEKLKANTKFTTIIPFNDSPNTTKEQVIALLDSAINSEVKKSTKKCKIK